MLVFDAPGAGSRDLYFLHLVDLRVTRLAETPDYEVDPSFSADEQQVVYAAGVPGDRADHLFIRPVDGGPSKQLTFDDANITSPRFSPDGATIVFARDTYYRWGGLAANWGGGGVICVIDSDGRNFRQLTPDDSYVYYPRFTPDGKSVIFATETGLESIPVDRSIPSIPIPGPFRSVFSPDGTLLAYPKGRYCPDLQIFVANADGESERLVAQGVGGCYQPVFNPAGDRLYFLWEEWPNGASGTPKFSVWETSAKVGMPRMIADRHLFDDPLNWTPPQTR